MTKYVCVWWESEVIQDQICLRCRRKEDDKRQNRFELWVTRTHLETIEDEKRQKHVWVLGENKTGRWCWYWSICSRRWWCQVTIMRRIGGYRHHYKYIHSSKLYHTLYITHCTLSITHGTLWIHLLLQLCHTVCSLIWRSSAVHYWEGGGYIRDTRWGNFYMQQDADTHIGVGIKLYLKLQQNLRPSSVHVGPK